MRNLDSIVVFVHILAGTTLVAMSAIMQLIVGPAIALLPWSADKNKLTDKLKKRRVPVIDGAIILQICTALYLFYFRWNMIISEPLMRVKVVFGTAALSLAFAVHFYFRYKKINLEKSGDMSSLQIVNKQTQIMEKLVLICGAITYILGIYFNHM
ncbi:MAG: hypothetical protein OEV66_09420 [Spirochaetia bacterium]|nr:hypothetical protein [Spirochaetia bacterium]